MYRRHSPIGVPGPGVGNDGVQSSIVQQGGQPINHGPSQTHQPPPPQHPQHVQPQPQHQDVHQQYAMHSPNLHNPHQNNITSPKMPQNQQSKTSVLRQYRKPDFIQENGINSKLIHQNPNSNQYQMPSKHEDYNQSQSQNQHQNSNPGQNQDSVPKIINNSVSNIVPNNNNSENSENGVFNIYGVQNRTPNYYQDNGQKSPCFENYQRPIISNTSEKMCNNFWQNQQLTNLPPEYNNIVKNSQNPQDYRYNYCQQKKSPVIDNNYYLKNCENRPIPVQNFQNSLDRRISPINQNFGPPNYDYSKNIDPRYQQVPQTYQKVPTIPKHKPNFTILEQRLTTQGFGEVPEFMHQKFPMIQSKVSPTPRSNQFIPGKNIPLEQNKFPDWPYPREFRDNRYFTDIAQLDPRMAQGIIQQHNSLKNYEIPRDRFIENVRNPYQNKIRYEGFSNRGGTVPLRPVLLPDQRNFDELNKFRKDLGACKMDTAAFREVARSGEEMYLNQQRGYLPIRNGVENPQRNISPRSTFQENMHTIVIPPQGIQNFTGNDFYNQSYFNNNNFTEQRPQVHRSFSSRFEGYPQDFPPRARPDFQYPGEKSSRLEMENRKFEPGKESEVSKLNLKEFFENWEDDEEIVANLPDLIPNTIERNMSVDSNYVSESSNDKASYEEVRSVENLYILEKQNISPEMLQNFQHLTPVERLPDNIKGYIKVPENKSESPKNPDQVLNLSVSKEENNNEKKDFVNEPHKSVIVSNIKLHDTCIEPPEKVGLPLRSPDNPGLPLRNLESAELPLTIPFKSNSSHQTENVNRLLEYVNSNTNLEMSETSQDSIQNGEGAQVNHFGQISAMQKENNVGPKENTNVFRDNFQIGPSKDAMLEVSPEIRQDLKPDMPLESQCRKVDEVYLEDRQCQKDEIYQNRPQCQKDTENILGNLQYGPKEQFSLENQDEKVDEVVLRDKQCRKIESPDKIGELIHPNLRNNYVVENVTPMGVEDCQKLNEKVLDERIPCQSIGSPQIGRNEENLTGVPLDPQECQNMDSCSMNQCQKLVSPRISIPSEILINENTNHTDFMENEKCNPKNRDFEKDIPLIQNQGCPNTEICHEDREPFQNIKNLKFSNQNEAHSENINLEQENCKKDICRLVKSKGELKSYTEEKVESLDPELENSCNSFQNSPQNIFRPQNLRKYCSELNELSENTNEEIDVTETKKNDDINHKNIPQGNKEVRDENLQDSDKKIKEISEVPFANPGNNQESDRFQEFIHEERQNRNDTSEEELPKNDEETDGNIKFPKEDSLVSEGIITSGEPLKNNLDDVLYEKDNNTSSKSELGLIEIESHKKQNDFTSEMELEEPESSNTGLIPSPKSSQEDENLKVTNKTDSTKEKGYISENSSKNENIATKLEIGEDADENYNKQPEICSYDVPNQEIDFLETSSQDNKVGENIDVIRSVSDEVGDISEDKDYIEEKAAIDDTILDTRLKDELHQSSLVTKNDLNTKVIVHESNLKIKYQNEISDYIKSKINDSTLKLKLKRNCTNSKSKSKSKSHLLNSDNSVEDEIATLPNYDQPINQISKSFKEPFYKHEYQKLEVSIPLETLEQKIVGTKDLSTCSKKYLEKSQIFGGPKNLLVDSAVQTNFELQCGTNGKKHCCVYQKLFYNKKLLYPILRKQHQKLQDMKKKRIKLKRLKRRAREVKIILARKKLEKNDILEENEKLESSKIQEENKITEENPIQEKDEYSENVIQEETEIRNKNEHPAGNEIPENIEIEDKNEILEKNEISAIYEIQYKNYNPGRNEISEKIENQDKNEIAEKNEFSEKYKIQDKNYILERNEISENTAIQDKNELPEETEILEKIEITDKNEISEENKVPEVSNISEKLEILDEHKIPEKNESPEKTENSEKTERSIQKENPEEYDILKKTETPTSSPMEEEEDVMCPFINPENPEKDDILPIQDPAKTSQRVDDSSLTDGLQLNIPQRKISIITDGVPKIEDSITDNILHFPKRRVSETVPPKGLSEGLESLTDELPLTLKRRSVDKGRKHFIPIDEISKNVLEALNTLTENSDSRKSFDSFEEKDLEKGQNFEEESKIHNFKIEETDRNRVEFDSKTKDLPDMCQKVVQKNGKVSFNGVIESNSRSKITEDVVKSAFESTEKKSDEYSLTQKLDPGILEYEKSFGIGPDTELDPILNDEHKESSHSTFDNDLENEEKDSENLEKDKIEPLLILEKKEGYSTNFQSTLDTTFQKIYLEKSTPRQNKIDVQKVEEVQNVENIFTLFNKNARLSEIGVDRNQSDIAKIKSRRKGVVDMISTKNQSDSQTLSKKCIEEIQNIPIVVENSRQSENAVENFIEQSEADDGKLLKVADINVQRNKILSPNNGEETTLETQSYGENTTVSSQYDSKNSIETSRIDIEDSKPPPEIDVEECKGHHQRKIKKSRNQFQDEVKQTPIQPQKEFEKIEIRMELKKIKPSDNEVIGNTDNLDDEKMTEFVPGNENLQKSEESSNPTVGSLENAEKHTPSKLDEEPPKNVDNFSEKLDDLQELETKIQNSVPDIENQNVVLLENIPKSLNQVNPEQNPGAPGQVHENPDQENQLEANLELNPQANSSPPQLEVELKSKENLCQSKIGDSLKSPSPPRLEPEIIEPNENPCLSPPKLDLEVPESEHPDIKIVEVEAEILIAEPKILIPDNEIQLPEMKTPVPETKIQAAEIKNLSEETYQPNHHKTLPQIPEERQNLSEILENDSSIGIIENTDQNYNYDEGILRNSPVSEVYYEEYIIENSGTYEDILISSDQTVIVASDDCSNDILKERTENNEIVLEQPGDEIMIENEVENIFQEVIIEDGVPLDDKDDLCDLENNQVPLEDPLASTELTPPPEFSSDFIGKRPFSQINGLFKNTPLELDIKKSLQPSNLVRVKPLNGVAKVKKINLSDYRKRKQNQTRNSIETPNTSNAETIEEDIIKLGQKDRIGNPNPENFKAIRCHKKERRSSKDKDKYLQDIIFDHTIDPRRRFPSKGSLKDPRLFSKDVFPKEPTAFLKNKHYDHEEELLGDTCSYELRKSLSPKNSEEHSKATTQKGSTIENHFENSSKTTKLPKRKEPSSLQDHPDNDSKVPKLNFAKPKMSTDFYVREERKVAKLTINKNKFGLREAKFEVSNDDNEKPSKKYFESPADPRTKPTDSNDTRTFKPKFECSKEDKSSSRSSRKNSLEAVDLRTYKNGSKDHNIDPRAFTPKFEDKQTFKLSRKNSIEEMANYDPRSVLDSNDPRTYKNGTEICNNEPRSCKSGVNNATNDPSIINMGTDRPNHINPNNPKTSKSEFFIEKSTLNGHKSENSKKLSKNLKKMYLLEAENGKNMLFLEPLVLKRSSSGENFFKNDSKRLKLESNSHKVDLPKESLKPKRRASESEQFEKRRKSTDFEKPKTFVEMPKIDNSSKEFVPTKRKRKKKRFRNLYTLSDSDDELVDQTKTSDPTNLDQKSNSSGLKVKIPIRDCFESVSTKSLKFLINNNKDKDNLIPKVLIKKNGTTYVSSFMKNIKEPFWQPRVILKRYPSSEILKITKNKT